jgi:hypothetical protein
LKKGLLGQSTTIDHQCSASDPFDIWLARDKNRVGNVFGSADPRQ